MPVYRALMPNITALFPAVLWIVGVIVLLVFLKRIGGSREFASYRDQFVVLESSVSQRVTSNASWVVITGVFTNQTGYTWKNIGLEGQLFDGAGKLIEVIPAEPEYSGRHVAGAHATAAFKIESRSSHDLKDVASHKVMVRWAKDGNSWP